MFKKHTKTLFSWALSLFFWGRWIQFKLRKKKKPSIWNTAEHMTEGGVGIRRRRRQRGRKQTAALFAAMADATRTLAWNWRLRVNKMFWKPAAKVANRQEREQPALSTAWRALVPPLCKGLSAGESWKPPLREARGWTWISDSLRIFVGNPSWFGMNGERGNKFAAFNSPVTPTHLRLSLSAGFVSIALSIISSPGLKLQIRGKSGYKSTGTTLVIIRSSSLAISVFAFAGNQLVSFVFQAD